MPTLKEAAVYGAELTNLADRFICAWWFAENGEEWPTTNNPGNISYSGKGVPSGGVFEGVTEVHSNLVCQYETWQDGVRAWAKLLEEPTEAHGGTKVLTVDLQDLHDCKDSIQLMCATVGRSNWAASHYMGEGQDAWEGGLIFEAYHNNVISTWYDEANPPAETKPDQKPKGDVYTVEKGDTLSAIAARYRVPLNVFARYNHIENPNLIEVGQELQIPNRTKSEQGQSFDMLAKKLGMDPKELQHVNGSNPERFPANTPVWF